MNANVINDIYLFFYKIKLHEYNLINDNCVMTKDKLNFGTMENEI